jgi:hypothetical protein
LSGVLVRSTIQAERVHAGRDETAAPHHRLKMNEAPSALLWIGDARLQQEQEWRQHQGSEDQDE